MEDFFKQWTLYLSIGVEAAAALVIAVAVLEAVGWSVVVFLSKGISPQKNQAAENIRLRLGRWLAVALEFELAADILRTAVAPSWNDIGQLAAIAVLRTGLNYFLQKEIDRGKMIDFQQKGEQS